MKFLNYFFILVISTTLFSCKKENNNQTNEEVPNFTGLLSSNPDSIRRIPIADTAILFNRRIAQLPTSFALDMPPIENQGSEGSCVAFSSAYAARSFHLHRDLNTAYINSNGSSNFNNLFSPEFLYNSAKASGDCGTAGMYFSTALEYLKNNGVCKWSTMPYSDLNGCTTLPNNSQTQEATQFKVNNYYRIADISTDNIKSMIFNQQPIIFGANLDQGFMNATSSFIWKEPIGNFVGRHAMVLCGWDDDKHAFKIMNSWGKNRADNGFYWVDYDYLDNVIMGSTGAYEMYVLQTTSNNNVIDIDGNVYHTVTIGTQTWMVENLKTTRYNDGSSIPNVTENTQWGNINTGAYCYYNNEPSYNNTYGKLYNWYAVNTGKLAPTGWHIPSDDEWLTLINYLGGASVAGGKMKTTGNITDGTGLWETPNNGATNSSGFTALPSGYRDYPDVKYTYLNKGAYFYSSTENTTTGNVGYVHLLNSYIGIMQFTGVSFTGDKHVGKPVRCLKD